MKLSMQMTMDALVRALRWRGIQLREDVVSKPSGPAESRLQPADDPVAREGNS